MATLFSISIIYVGDSKITYLFKTSNSKLEIPKDFNKIARQAISLVQKSDELSTDKEFLDYLTNNGYTLRILQLKYYYYYRSLLSDYGFRLRNGQTRI